MLKLLFDLWDRTRSCRKKFRIMCILRKHKDGLTTIEIQKYAKLEDEKEAIKFLDDLYLHEKVEKYLQAAVTSYIKWYIKGG